MTVTLFFNNYFTKIPKIRTARKLCSDISNCHIVRVTIITMDSAQQAVQGTMVARCIRIVLYL